jgi:acyl carrier protein
MTLHDEVKRVVVQHLDAGLSAADVGDQQPLADLGLDSMRSINLLLDLESTLGVVFPDEELTAANFHTLAAIESLVARLQKSMV